MPGADVRDPCTARVIAEPTVASALGGPPAPRDAPGTAVAL